MVETIVRELVQRPDEVSINEIRRGHTAFIEVKAGPGEAGLVIGKRGLIADAIRTLLNSVGSKERTRYILSVQQ